MANGHSLRDLSKLIGSIYDCAIDPGHWDETLVDLKDALHCENAALHLNDLRRDRFLIRKQVGVEPYWQEQQAKYVAEINAHFAKTLGSWPSYDEPHLISRHVARAYYETSPYIQECLKPQGIVDVLQYFLMVTSTRLSGIGLGRHERYGIITEREIELGRLLVPHIRRAVTISNVLDARTIERARMADALDALRCGVVLTDSRGAILHANRSADALFSNSGPVQGAGGVLQGRDPRAASELRSAIALAARDEASIGKAGTAIRLTEPDVPPIFAHVLPMTGSDLRTRLQPEAVAAVFIGAMPDEHQAADIMAAAFDLTAAETRVLANLLAPRTLDETAAALGIAPTTAKKHLNNIFSKTGVSRQAELIHLAAQVAPPTRSVVTSRVT